LFVLSNSLISSASVAPQIVESKICQKDMQVRMILVKKEKNKFSTIFHKQSEELLSGSFSDLEAATQALLEIEKKLVELGWSCKSVKAEYLVF